jgi:uncharacterized Zn finger protein
MRYYDYPKYFSLSDRKEKTAKIVSKLRKNNIELNPIIIEDNKLITTWWGKAWCDNLKSYNDYDNRLPRGRSYVKNGFVIHLEIFDGHVKALVCGSKLYEVVIKIKHLNSAVWDKICLKASNNIQDLSVLINGKFPHELADIFMRKGDGLFPTPNQINFDCSCPDHACMCKHVAAVMYGIGCKLDKDPLLFFKLRGVDPHELIKKSVADKIQSLLKNADRKSERVISNANINKLFGI